MKDFYSSHHNYYNFVLKKRHKFTCASRFVRSLLEARFPHPLGDLCVGGRNNTSRAQCSAVHQRREKRKITQESGCMLFADQQQRSEKQREKNRVGLVFGSIRPTLWRQIFSYLFLFLFSKFVFLLLRASIIMPCSSLLREKRRSAPFSHLCTIIQATAADLNFRFLLIKRSCLEESSDEEGKNTTDRTVGTNCLDVTIDWIRLLPSPIAFTVHCTKKTLSGSVRDCEYTHSHKKSDTSTDGR